MPGGKNRIDEYNKSLTAEERKVNASRAGKASAERQRELRPLKDLAKKLLNVSVGKGPAADVDDMESLAQVGESNIDVRTGLVLALIKKGLDGDVKAQELLFTMAGEKVDRKEVELTAVNGFPQPTIVYLPDNGR